MFNSFVKSNKFTDNFIALKFISSYYFLYSILVLISNVFFIWPTISYFTVLIISLYYFFFFLGLISGSYINRPIEISHSYSVNNFIKYFPFAMMLGPIAIWLILIKEYGGLAVIFTIGNAIRYDQIGQDTGIFPPILTYFNSIVYASFAIYLSLYLKNRSFVVLRGVILLFISIFLIDLSLFGRIGMIYSLFMLIGFIYFLKKELNQQNKRVSKKKIILYSSILLILTISPRIIRSTEINQEPLNEYYNDNALRFPLPIYLQQVDQIVYTMVGPYYALDYKLGKDFEYGFGKANFTPVYRFLVRVGLINYNGYYNRIDENAINLSREFNVYSIIWDAYYDFGILGVIILPFIIGLYFAVLFKTKGLYHTAEKIYLTGWLGFSIFFNAFAFGNFMISWLLIVFFKFFTRIKFSPVKN